MYNYIHNSFHLFGNAKARRGKCRNSIHFLIHEFKLEDVQRSAIETDSNFVVTLFVIVSFFLAWLPIVILHFLPETWINPADTATMKFSFVWMGIGCCSLKFLIFLFINRDFREYFCAPCLGQEAEFYGSADENFSTTRTHHQPGILSRLFCFCCPRKQSQPPVQRQRYGRNETTTNSQLRSFQHTEFDSTRNLPSNSFGYYPNGSANATVTKPLASARYTGYGTLTQLPPGF
jgi:hypothetical protein